MKFSLGAPNITRKRQLKQIGKNPQAWNGDGNGGCVEVFGHYTILKTIYLILLALQCYLLEAAMAAA